MFVQCAEFCWDFKSKVMIRKKIQKRENKEALDEILMKTFSNSGNGRARHKSWLKKRWSRIFMKRASNSFDFSCKQRPSKRSTAPPAFNCLKRTLGSINKVASLCCQSTFSKLLFKMNIVNAIRLCFFITVSVTNWDRNVIHRFLFCSIF